MRKRLRLLLALAIPISGYAAETPVMDDNEIITVVPAKGWDPVPPEERMIGEATKSLSSIQLSQPENGGSFLLVVMNKKDLKIDLEDQALHEQATAESLGSKSAARRSRVDAKICGHQATTSHIIVYNGELLLELVISTFQDDHNAYILTASAPVSHYLKCKTGFREMTESLKRPKTEGE